MQGYSHRDARILEKRGVNQRLKIRGRPSLNVHILYECGFIKSLSFPSKVIGLLGLISAIHAVSYGFLLIMKGSSWRVFLGKEGRIWLFQKVLTKWHN